MWIAVHLVHNAVLSKQPDMKRAHLEALDVHVNVRVQREERPDHRIHAVSSGDVPGLDHKGQEAAAAARLRRCIIHRERRRMLGIHAII